MRKTLEASIAERLDRMSKLVPNDQVAFENYCSMLESAQIDESHDALKRAFVRASRELGLFRDARTIRVLRHMQAEKKRAAVIAATPPVHTIHWSELRRGA